MTRPVALVRPHAHLSAQLFDAVCWCQWETAAMYVDVSGALEGLYLHTSTEHADVVDVTIRLQEAEK